MICRSRLPRACLQPLRLLLFSLIASPLPDFICRYVLLDVAADDAAAAILFRADAAAGEAPMLRHARC